MKKYLDAEPESGKKFYQDFNGKGKVVMLNLLKYKSKADYSNLENLRPANEVSGEEAYGLYLKYTMPELTKAGSKILFYGSSRNFLIGPENECWDAVLLVEHESVERFIALSQSKDYMKTAGHRTAALEDSRLLPINQNTLNL
ncbi:DUF1330 domain-containing protein [Fulvivirga ulvae]|uniref:DUF1330 domain-containing protein n=1 Tax=Fulvivirga ulvae TaxID=2904245 RepID=UPI001F223180|nr:DUF1330 domain-containing protein [Fulvivirga ulvae]UII35003.1 DUF1330 domain-containing protein [Fulvivirga ulvae]